MSYYVYIVKCKDGSFYTGSSNDVEKRVQEHNNSSRGAKSLRGKKPVALVHKETMSGKKEALKREREIKSWSRKKKLELIEKQS